MSASASAPAGYSKQYAIRHKPTGKFYGSGSNFCKLYLWNPADSRKNNFSNEVCQAKKPKQPKMYRSAGAVRTALSNYWHDKSELEIVEFSLVETSTQKV